MREVPTTGAAETERPSDYLLADLLLLAPDVAERVLFLEAVDGVEPMAERALRSLVRHESWAGQRRAWAVQHPTRP